MNRLFFTLLVAGTVFTYSCNSDNNDAVRKEEKTEVSQKEGIEKTGERTKEESVKEEAEAKAVKSTEAKATAEMCDCINSSLKGMSPKIQQIFIRAGNSNRPLQVLQDEIVTISDQEQMELFEQLQRFSTDPQMQKCSDDIRRKYGLNENDKRAQEKVLNAAKENKDCALVYALIKIGMQQQPGTGADN